MADHVVENNRVNRIIGERGLIDALESAIELEFLAGDPQRLLIDINRVDLKSLFLAKMAKEPKSTTYIQNPGPEQMREHLSVEHRRKLTIASTQIPAYEFVVEFVNDVLLQQLQTAHFHWTSLVPRNR
jgi:hypothetical protein